VSFGSGSLTIAAGRAGRRTVLERVRYEGISRCSRAFAHGDAALVVLSQLGPGVVRGDAVTTTGIVRANAHLIVTSQTATRLMGGPRASHSRATWVVEDDAVLEIVGEPLVASADARYEATTSVELGTGSLVLVSEIAAVPRAAHVRVRMLVARGGRDLFYDAFDAGAAAPHVIGTLALVGLAPDRIAPLVAALDAAADASSAGRVGVGALLAGAVARILADDIWSVRSTLESLRSAAWAALQGGAGAAALTRR
jgi:urease accessory protein UreH